jgi:tRNA threonylcarbamoyladenosine biosynthesis protein TsaB
MQQVYCAAIKPAPMAAAEPITLQDPQDVILPEGITMLAGDGFTNYPALLMQQRDSTTHTGVLRADARAHASWHKVAATRCSIHAKPSCSMSATRLH